jgi:glyoxylase-like metal-dependent hydrolase (beta-lactamase superfamily II)
MKRKVKLFIVLNLLTLSVLLIGFRPANPAEKNIAFINSSLFQILPNIYVYKDICNVYVLKSGNSALLIDAGSGNIASHLNEIGVDKVEWILHTHYHRDQCIGSSVLNKSGAKIAISEKEADLLNRDEKTSPFKLPETLLLNGELPGWGKRLAPFQSVETDKSLTDGEEFVWNQYKIKIIDTPGHTEGSISFLVEVDGKRLCFTGDLIMKGGHVRDLYSMQWVYLQNPGIAASISSLSKLDEINANVLLPSHGEIISSPAEDIKLLD